MDKIYNNVHTYHFEYVCILVLYVSYTCYWKFDQHDTNFANVVLIEYSISTFFGKQYVMWCALTLKYLCKIYLILQFYNYVYKIL